MLPDEDIAVQKPGAFDLDKFKSKTTPAVAGVETLLTALPHCSLSQAKDSVRLHSYDFPSPELCFVPLSESKGQKNQMLHLIVEDLAVRYLPSARKVQRFLLALWTKPNDVFFLCRVPSRNLDNAWNAGQPAGVRTGSEALNAGH